ncbi:hypothetical protein [Streptodolium elevatio]|uniref:Uncharacterized protein n=1 Tax=Streptodolium elevatio TaxID=3157996 RepID=A0ABV3D860_9ACTN
MLEPQHFTGHGDQRRIKQERRAAAWRYNPEMERLAALRDKDPAAYERLSPTVHMSLGYYDQDKAVAQQFGRDVSATGNQEG